MAAISRNKVLDKTYNDIWGNCKEGLKGLDKDKQIELISNMIFMKLSSNKQDQIIIKKIETNTYQQTNDYKCISKYVAERLNAIPEGSDKDPSSVMNHFQNLEQRNPKELRLLGKYLFQLICTPEHKESAQRLINEFMKEEETESLPEEKRIVFVGYLDCVLESLERERNLPKLNATYEYRKKLLKKGENRLPNQAKDESPFPSINTPPVPFEDASLAFNRLKNLEEESEQDLKSLGQLLFKLSNQPEHKGSAQSIIDQFKREAKKERLSEKEKIVFFAYLDCVMDESEKNDSFGLWTEAFVYKADMITSEDKKVPDLPKDATSDIIRNHTVMVGHFLEPKSSL